MAPAQRHFRDVRRPTGLTLGARQTTQTPVICEQDILLGMNQGGDDATLDASRVTCRGCRARLDWRYA